MEELKRGFSDIIDSHGSSINRGITDLVTEVSKMQKELTIIRKEQNVLIETVHNLNGEIKQLNIKLNMAHSLPELEEASDKAIQEDVIEVKLEPLEQDIESQDVLNYPESEEVYTNSQEFTDKTIKEQRENNIGELMNHSNNSPIKDTTEADVDRSSRMKLVSGRLLLK